MLHKIKVLLRRQRFEALLNRLDHCDDLEMNEAVQHIIHWYHIRHEDWDISFLSLPKDREKRRRHLEQLLHMLW